tara:strand:+ start:4314 stop:5213 length:900 start_codon:yes stop_codon:yes gene_type:complete
MKNRILNIALLLFLGLSTSINAQDLLDKLNKEFPDNLQFTLATFKTTRIAIGQSVETRAKGVFEISMINRFWNIPNENTQTFLADKVNTRFAVDYGISDRFTIGFGASTFDKLFDGSLKYRLFRQNSKKSSVSITLFQNISYDDTENKTIVVGYDNSTRNRVAFTTQILIAKKFNQKFSAQISPTFIHRSSSISPDDPNNQFAIGFGARHKIGSHTSVVSEYYYVANPMKTFDTYNAFVLGINWEVSDLMLQFNVTNARNVVEDAFITKTRNNFNFHDGNFHFGFSATLVLHSKKNKLD